MVMLNYTYCLCDIQVSILCWGFVSMETTQQFGSCKLCTLFDILDWEDQICEIKIRSSDYTG